MEAIDVRLKYPKICLKLISRNPGGGELSLFVCPWVGNRTLRKRGQVAGGVPGGGWGVVTATIKPYIKESYLREVESTL